MRRLQDYAVCLLRIRQSPYGLHQVGTHTEKARTSDRREGADITILLSANRPRHTIEKVQPLQAHRNQQSLSLSSCIPSRNSRKHHEAHGTFQSPRYRGHTSPSAVWRPDQIHGERSSSLAKSGQVDFSPASAALMPTVNFAPAVSAFFDPSTGSFTKNVAPWLRPALSAQMSPWCSRTICWAT